MTRDESYNGRIFHILYVIFNVSHAVVTHSILIMKKTESADAREGVGCDTEAQAGSPRRRLACMLLPISDTFDIVHICSWKKGNCMID